MLPGGLSIAVAASRRARGRGLARIDADGLDTGHALLIPGCRSVHTAGMRFALDLVWLDSSGAVVRVDESVVPRRLRTCLRARAVVETHAGGGQDFARALGQVAVAGQQRL